MTEYENKYYLSNLKNAVGRLFILLIVFMCAGCNSADHIPPADTHLVEDTIQKEVVAKISRRVIGDIPVTGRLRMIREKGVLRAAIPPVNPGFQETDPEFGIPRGFHPALIREIALILDVKPNITLLDKAPALPDFPTGWERDYDLIIIPEGMGGCGAGHGTKFFFTGPEYGWKTFCAANEGDALIQAIEEILLYLNESGIFARLHKTYVRR